MKRILTAIACLGSVLLGAFSAAQASPAPVEKAILSTPRILVITEYEAMNPALKGLVAIRRGTGSGVLVHKGTKYGTVVTNAHVVAAENFSDKVDGVDVAFEARSQTTFVIFPQKSGEAEPRVYCVVENLVRSNVKGMQEADVAALSISAKGLPEPVKFRDSDLKVGDMVYALGYPAVLDAHSTEFAELGAFIYKKWEKLGSPRDTYFTIENLSNVKKFLNITVTQGPVQRMDSGAGSLSAVYHGAQIDQGNSGGPLVSETGHIAGINTWSKANTSTWSISMSGKTVMGTLLQNNVEFSIASAGPTVGGPIEDDPQQPAQDNTVAYVIVGVVAVALIALLAVVLLRSGKENVLLTIQVAANQGSRDAGRAFEITDKMLAKGEILLGRGDMCALKMMDEHISRAHCGISLVSNCVCITDKGSKAGTKLNGTVLTPGKPSSLNKGATLEFGKIKAHVS